MHKHEMIPDGLASGKDRRTTGRIRWTGFAAPLSSFGPVRKQWDENAGPPKTSTDQGCGIAMILPLSVIVASGWSQGPFVTILNCVLELQTALNFQRSPAFQSTKLNYMPLQDHHYVFIGLLSVQKKLICDT